MCKTTRNILKSGKLTRDESGQIMLLALVLLLVGSIMVASILAYGSTSVKSSASSVKNMRQIYAADAGLKDALYRLTTDYTTISSNVGTGTWQYGSVANPPTLAAINNNTLAVTIGSIATDTYKITSTATSGGSSATVEAYTSGVLIPSFFKNGATSAGPITTHGSTIQYPDGSPAPIVDNYTGPWPDATQLETFYQSQVPYPASQEKVPTSDDSNTGGFTTSPLWSKVDETPLNLDDTDFITGVTNAGGRATFGFPAFTVPSGVTIQNLTIYYRARDNVTGTNNIRSALKIGTQYYDALSSPATPDPGVDPPKTTKPITTYSYAYTNNPKTGSPWTVDEINRTGLEASGANDLTAFGVSSNNLNPDVNVYMVYAQVNYTTITPGPSYNPINTTTEHEVGPMYTDHTLDISSANNGGMLTLDGTVYVHGDLTTGNAKTQTINLNGKTIFVTGNVDIVGNVTISGSGAIIAEGYINFMPNIAAGSENNFIFLMSISSYCNLQPSSNFYGTVAGQVSINLQPGNTLTLTEPPPGSGINFPSYPSYSDWEWSVSNWKSSR